MSQLEGLEKSVVIPSNHVSDMSHIYGKLIAVTIHLIT